MIVQRITILMNNRRKNVTRGLGGPECVRTAKKANREERYEWDQANHHIPA